MACDHVEASGSPKCQLRMKCPRGLAGVSEGQAAPETTGYLHGTPPMPCTLSLLFTCPNIMHSTNIYTQKIDCDFSKNNLPPQFINNLVSLPKHFHFHFSRPALSSLCLFLLHFVTGSLSVCHSGESFCSVASKILAAEKPAN